MNVKFAEVFKPGTYPQMTYVSRSSKGTRYTYEDLANKFLE